MMLSVVLAIYGSQGWNSTLDWAEVIFADCDFICDILFCLEVYRMYIGCSPHVQSGSSSPDLYLSKSCPVVKAYTSNLQALISSASPAGAGESSTCFYDDQDCCYCGSGSSDTCSSTYYCDTTWTPKYKDTLFVIWVSSAAFIAIPVAVNLCIICLSLCHYSDSGDDERHPAAKCYHSNGIRDNIVALHHLIKTPLLNPFFFLVYLLLHAINIILIATCAERLAKILVKDGNPRHLACINTFGFVFETIPQLACQGFFLYLTGGNRTAIVSVAISCYRTLSSYTYKVFFACFPRAQVQDFGRDLHKYRDGGQSA
jgi:hypothetical protein